MGDRTYLRKLGFVGVYSKSQNEIGESAAQLFSSGSAALRAESLRLSDCHLVISCEAMPRRRLLVVIEIRVKRSCR